jgi:hypothetical protein
VKPWVVETVEIDGREYWQTPGGFGYTVDFLLDYFGADYAHLDRWRRFIPWDVDDDFDPREWVEMIVAHEPGITPNDLKLIRNLWGRVIDFKGLHIRGIEQAMRFLANSDYPTIGEAQEAMGEAAFRRAWENHR